MRTKVLLWAMPFILSACASQPPAPEVDLGGGGQTNTEVSGAKDPQSAVRSPQSTSRPTEPPQQPVPIRERQLAKGIPPAAESLLARAQRDLDEGNYDSAIANAERGLRIARTSAELLMVLARSYQAQGDYTQARVFAKRGLRYLPAGAKRKQFERLLEGIPD